MQLKFTVLPQDPPRGVFANATRVGYVEGAIGGPERVMSLAALFPNVDFVSVGASWPLRPIAGLSALIAGAAAAEVDSVLARLPALSAGPPVIIALRDADVAMTRRLMRGGAADILPAPVSDAALALSLERILAGRDMARPSAPTGKIIGLLKAGGGVGATLVGTQLAAMLASRGDDAACFADLDLQFGLGALYLDLAEAITLSDILGSGGSLADAPLATAIARHRSGARLLAAPREFVPLETLSPQDVEGLAKALKRDFRVTLLDLPTVWTAWTNQALQLCDRILLITNLSVAHINLVQRQLRMLAAQRLDTVPLTLVCNRLSSDQSGVVSIKAAENVLRRKFDAVLPEDRRLVNDAIAQGCQLSAIRRGAKLERALAELAAVIAPVEAARDEGRARVRP